MLNKRKKNTTPKRKRKTSNRKTSKQPKTPQKAVPTKVRQEGTFHCLGVVGQKQSGKSTTLKRMTKVAAQFKRVFFVIPEATTGYGKMKEVNIENIDQMIKLPPGQYKVLAEDYVGYKNLTDRNGNKINRTYRTTVYDYIYELAKTLVKKGDKRGIVVIFDDFKGYTSDNLPDKCVSILVSNRHLKIDGFFVGQNIGLFPPKLIGMSNGMMIFKTDENIDRKTVRDKLPDQYHPYIDLSIRTVKAKSVSQWGYFIRLIWEEIDAYEAQLKEPKPFTSPEALAEIKVKKTKPKKAPTRRNTTTKGDIP